MLAGMAKGGFGAAGKIAEERTADTRRRGFLAEEREHQAGVRAEGQKFQEGLLGKQQAFAKESAEEARTAGRVDKISDRLARQAETEAAEGRTIAEKERVRGQEEAYYNEGTGEVLPRKEYEALPGKEKSKFKHLTAIEIETAQKKLDMLKAGAAGKPVDTTKGRKDAFKYGQTLTAEYSDQGKEIPSGQLKIFNMMLKEAGLPQVTNKKLKEGWFSDTFGIEFEGEETRDIMGIYESLGRKETPGKERSSTATVAEGEKLFAPEIQPEIPVPTAIKKQKEKLGGMGQRAAEVEIKAQERLRTRKSNIAKTLKDFKVSPEDLMEAAREEKARGDMGLMEPRGRPKAKEPARRALFRLIKGENPLMRLSDLLSLMESQ
jgi:hypothetical protein